MALEQQLFTKLFFPDYNVVIKHNIEEEEEDEHFLNKMFSKLLRQNTIYRLLSL